MELEITKPQTVNAKTLKIHLKVADRFSASLVSDKGEEIVCQEDGYVPGFMPGDHHGDYVILDIDIDTGLITNWRLPHPETIAEWINEQNEI